MSTTYYSTLKGLSPTKRTTIKNILNKWYAENDIGRVVCSNIEKEHFLSAKRMVKILEVIFNNSANSTDRIQTAYKQECFKHVRKGQKIKTQEPPQLLGRVVGKEFFIKYLERKRETLFASKRQREDFIDKLIAGGPLTDGEKTALMSEFTAWVTWDDKNPAGYPFSFAKDPNKKKEQIIGMLGVGSQAHGPTSFAVYLSSS